MTNMQDSDKSQARVLTWNCARATAASQLWDYFEELAPDVAVLQEVSSIPPAIAQNYDVRTHREVNKEGKEQRTSSALLVRGMIGEEICLKGSHDWVDRELARFAGNLPAYQVELQSGVRLNVVGVYSPYWDLMHLLKGVDISSVKLKHNAKLWVANLLYDALRCADLDSQQAWVIAGDFNFSETFDYWTSRPRGNREYLDNMMALGLTECLRESSGRLTPTFKNRDGGKVTAQIDHLWVTQPLASGLVSCSTGAATRVFGAHPKPLSDHLPIIADFSSRAISS